MDHAYKRLIKHGFLLFAALLAITAVIRNAEPVKDGDFFWHARYGQYMVENRTLIPDHAIYSWTPADNTAIKCNWMADILLHLMDQIGGLPLLFAFRYLCVLVMLIIVGTYLYRMKRLKEPLGFFLLAFCILGTWEAVYLKPEILSMIFMALVPAIYFHVKSSLSKRWGTRLFFLYPVLVIFWVNTHEVFLFGMVVLAMITAGEILNFLFNRQGALTAEGLRHLVSASLISVAATFATPYGYGIHLKYWNKLIGPQDQDLTLKTVMAYINIFSQGMRATHFAQLWVVMTILFGLGVIWMLVKKRHLDFGILLPNVFLAAIAARYGRAFYYWPVFWAMTLVHLQSATPLPRVDRKYFQTLLPLILTLASVFICGRAIYDAMYRPILSRWMGFGISYFNPVQESAFLKKHHPGTRLYNSYNPGGYLIYDLYPDYKVFCDGRSFPFKSWYKEYWGFNTGKTTIEEFQKKYDFDVALVDYFSSTSPILKFLVSKDWEPVFYGPVAMVFVRKGSGFSHDFREDPKERFKDLKSLYQANLVLYVAQNLNDLNTSGYILDLIKNKFSSRNTGYEKVVKEGSLFQQGLEAFTKGDLENAFQCLNQVGSRQHTPNANIALFQLRQWKAKQLIDKGRFEDALTLLEAIIKENPEFADGFYNAGLIGYYVELRKSGQDSGTHFNQNLANILSANTNWRGYLTRFLQLAPDHRYSHVARQILDGKGIPSNVTLAL